MTPRDRFLATCLCGSGALSLALAAALLGRGVSATGTIVAAQAVFLACCVLLRQIST